jgi:hypothetical protein
MSATHQGSSHAAATRHVAKGCIAQAKDRVWNDCRKARVWMCLIDLRGADLRAEMSNRARDSAIYRDNCPEP